MPSSSSAAAAAAGGGSPTSVNLSDFFWWSTRPSAAAAEDDRPELIIDPEALLREERRARMMMEPRRAPRLPSDGKLFEHFIVVGVPSERESKPEILFHFPESPIEIPGLADFCFPSGLAAVPLTHSRSQSEVLALLLNQEHLSRPDAAHVFLLTTLDQQHLFGVCVTRMEPVELRPSYCYPDRRLPSSLSLSDLRHQAPRCYCIITAYPFIPTHLSFLYGLLSIEHIAVLNCYGSSFSAPEIPRELHRAGVSQQQLQHHATALAAAVGKAPPTSGPHPQHAASMLDLPAATEAAPSADADGAGAAGGGGNRPIAAMFQYYRSTVPKHSQSLVVTLSEGIDTVKFRRLMQPTREEEEMLARWCLPVALSVLSVDHLVQLLTHCLLEKHVVVQCSNPRVLCAVLLSIIPMLVPFTYQCCLIPVLPHCLHEFLEAPVPFVLGITSPPKHPLAKDRFLLNIDQNKVFVKDAVPPLPASKEFKKALKNFQRDLGLLYSRKKIAYDATEAQMRVGDALRIASESFFSNLFAGFRKYCLSDRTDSDNPITIFLKDSFLADVPKKDRPFMKDFLETQIFNAYCDTRLRTIDESSKPDRADKNAMTM